MDSIVILTGAGISAESGLGTFRDEGGLWSEYSLEDVATPEGFAQNPERVHAFYNARRANCLDATPNAAHAAIALLERSGKAEVTIVTQNIDDLHERAGSKLVIHMHGELLQALCAACDHRWAAPARMSAEMPCPQCTAPATRPDVVWFGEIPYHMERIEALLAHADIFVAIGTSGTVYPAAGFVAEARMQGAHSLELNAEASEVAGLFDDVRIGPATRTVPAWVAELTGG